MNTLKKSRGQRNLNPGNIRRSKVRYKGEKAESTDPEFRQFESIEWGYRAMFVLLHTYSVRYGCDTLSKMISRYAPPSENDTAAYIRRVALRTGIDPDRPIDTADASVMPKIVAAMSEVENGVGAIREEVLRGWQLYVDDFGAGKAGKQ